MTKDGKGCAPSDNYYVWITNNWTETCWFNEQTFIHIYIYLMHQRRETKLANAFFSWPIHFASPISIVYCRGIEARNAHIRWWSDSQYGEGTRRDGIRKDEGHIVIIGEAADRHRRFDYILGRASGFIAPDRIRPRWFFDFVSARRNPRGILKS